MSSVADRVETGVFERLMSVVRRRILNTLSHVDRDGIRETELTSYLQTTKEIKRTRWSNGRNLVPFMFRIDFLCCPDQLPVRDPSPA